MFSTVIYGYTFEVMLREIGESNFVLPLKTAKFRYIHVQTDNRLVKSTLLHAFLLNEILFVVSFPLHLPDHPPPPPPPPSSSTSRQIALCVPDRRFLYGDPNSESNFCTFSVAPTTLEADRCHE